MAEELTDYSLPPEVIELLNQADIHLSLAELNRYLPELRRLSNDPEFAALMAGFNQAVAAGQIADPEAAFIEMLQSASIKDLADLGQELEPQTGVELESVTYSFIRDGELTTTQFLPVERVIELIASYDHLQYVQNANPHYIINFDEGVIVLDDTFIRFDAAADIDADLTDELFLYFLDKFETAPLRYFIAEDTAGDDERISTAFDLVHQGQPYENTVEQLKQLLGSEHADYYITTAGKALISFY